MTYREILNKKKRKFSTSLGMCALVAIATAYLSVRWDVLFLVTLACVLVAFGILYFAVIFGFRCPGCKAQWGYLAMYSGRPFSIRKDLKYCPYCGVELDA